MRGESSPPLPRPPAPPLSPDPDLIIKHARPLSLHPPVQPYASGVPGHASPLVARRPPRLHVMVAPFRDTRQSQAAVAEDRRAVRRRGGGTVRVDDATAEVLARHEVRDPAQVRLHDSEDELYGR